MLEDRDKEINKLLVKEPYPYFFGSVHQLLVDQDRLIRLKILLTKIFIGIIIAYIVITVLLCIASILAPIFGASLLTWIWNQIKLPSGSVFDGGM